MAGAMYTQVAVCDAKVSERNELSLPAISMSWTHDNNHRRCGREVDTFVRRRRGDAPREQDTVLAG